MYPVVSEDWHASCGDPDSGECVRVDLVLLNQSLALLVLQTRHIQWSDGTHQTAFRVDPGESNAGVVMEQSVVILNKELYYFICN